MYSEQRKNLRIVIQQHLMSASVWRAFHRQLVSELILSPFWSAIWLCIWLVCLTCLENLYSLSYHRLLLPVKDACCTVLAGFLLHFLFISWPVLDTGCCLPHQNRIGRFTSPREAQGIGLAGCCFLRWWLQSVNSSRAACYGPSNEFVWLWKWSYEWDTTFGVLPLKMIRLLTVDHSYYGDWPYVYWVRY